MDYLEIEGKAQLKRFGIPVNESILLAGEDIPEEIVYRKGRSCLEKEVKQELSGW